MGKIANNAIKPALGAGKVLIPLVHSNHSVLATEYSGNSIFMNDPGYSTTSYDLSAIKDNETVNFDVIAKDIVS